MKWLGSGMQARFLLAMGGAMVVVVAILAVLLGRQTAMQSEVRTLSGGVIHELFDRSVRSRGEAMARELSDALANPLYYRDLDQVGVLVRSTARQPVVRYVLVFDERGRLVHDGSVEVPGFGQPMADPLAPKAAAAQALLVQESPKVLDNTMPIMVGNQRIGGVRVGMALDEVQQREQAANATLGERLQLVGSRHLGWLLLMLGLLVVIGVVVILYVQRTLVAPIRDLAAAARRIEAGDYQTPLAENTRDDEVGELVRGFARMRDAIARHDREVRRMAYTDALTGLTNRLAFREALDHRLMAARAANHRLGLLFADIDDFKRVNDTLGHEAGDEALLQFAQRIGRAVAEAGGDEALLARFGGDEFVILVGDGDVAANARLLAEVLVRELGRPLVVQGRELFLGTSIGVTLFPDDAADATTLLKKRRHRHVPGEDGRQELLSLLQPGDGPRGRTSRAYGTGAARGLGARRTAPGLPADLPHARPPHGRRRSAAALAASDLGHDSAIGVHRGGRAERPDRDHRSESPACGLHGGLAMATWRGRRRPVRIGQRVTAAAARRRTAGAGRAVPA